MPSLDSKLRSQLDDVCQKAREVAEAAARSALQKRAVDVAEPHSHFGPNEKKLRNRLRARGRQVGDVRNADKSQSIDGLTQELAYEFWHRMLFARFLAENHLLMHPNGVAVSLEECEELAADEAAPNGFVLAAQYASKMLPQVFRTDDVLLELEFAPEHRLALEKLLAKLPRETFLADDSLGWVYQFWQTARKKAVNESGNKIDSSTISSVTQLFTEDYMVQFLLHNTLGAWWCAKEGISGQGAGVSTDKCPAALEYLRWRDDGSPAAGKFEGWPKTLKEFTLLDPCCGSGHFLVAAFNLLVPLRMHDEGLSAREACDAVLRENLFGLELDPRCTQIAAFALAIAAWKYPGEDGQPVGYRDDLPTLNIACAGIGPQASEEEWLKLAEQSGLKMNALSREPIMNGLRNLHSLFSNAPTLGSLIDPNQLSADLITADYETLKPYLSAALKAEQSDDDAHERAVAAAGMVKAAELLAGEYTLVITNVPYLGRGRQSEVLANYCRDFYSDSKADLAACFVDRCIGFSRSSGTIAIVAKQEPLFLGQYKNQRTRLLKNTQWDFAVKLGPRAFETISGERVTVALLSVTQLAPQVDHRFVGLDASKEKSSAQKAIALRTAPTFLVGQRSQLDNPDSRIIFEEQEGGSLLKDYVSALAGHTVGDSVRFTRYFWEVAAVDRQWEFLQSTADQTCSYGGKSEIIFWEDERGQMYRLAQSVKHLNHVAQNWLRGKPNWGKRGVIVNQMSNLYATLYLGQIYDCNCCALVPKREEDLPALWAYCSSEEFAKHVRQLDQKIAIQPHTLAKVPFDLDRWHAIASTAYPTGLKTPFSSDPAQWLFGGHPMNSNNPLQVGVARLVGYQWPRQTGSSFPDCPALGPDGLESLADEDGIVCIPAVRTESPAADRLLDILRTAYGNSWSDSMLHELLTDAGCQAGATIDDWLRNQFFEQHFKLFHYRPFIWHIWDGRKDGFAALVNYHKLNHKALDNLTNSHLRDWITAQSKSDKAGADLRMGAAQELQKKLKAILVGETYKNPKEPDPSKQVVDQFFDIFVRWKPLHEQAIGWHPDLNDGVRMNIRPFMEAGILRKNPNIKWTKDRGKEPEQNQNDYPWLWSGNEFVGDRVNGVHLTNAEKTAARTRKKGAK
jgi:hypothetical protein